MFIWTVPVLLGIPAYVYMWMRRSVAMDGMDVVLYCRATGYPAPQIKWYNPSGHLLSRHDERHEVSYH